MEFTSGVIVELNDAELRFLNVDGDIYESDMDRPTLIEQGREYFCDIDTALALFPVDLIDGKLSILAPHHTSLAFFGNNDIGDASMQRIEHAAWMVWCRSQEDYAGIGRTAQISIATHEESTSVADFGDGYFVAAFADATDNSIHINEHYLYGASDIALAGTLAHEGTHITRMRAYGDYSEDCTVLANVRTLTRIGASERLIREQLDTAAAIPNYNTGFHTALDWYDKEVGELYLVA